MCCSAIGQIIFGVLITLSIGLTLAAMFSDGWRHYENEKGDSLPSKQGILSWTCKMPNAPTASPVNGSTEDFCKQWWDHLKTWEKVVVATISVGLIFEVIAFLWNIFTFFACCCKKYVIHPLTLWASLAAIFIAIAVIVYGVNNSDAVHELQKWAESKAHKPPKSTSVGYSFYMACAALVCNIAATIVGMLTVCLAERCL